MHVILLGQMTNAAPVAVSERVVLLKDVDATVKRIMLSVDGIVTPW
jgi:hypothetical protein